ncbi:hypothetical protein CASFOL_022644 [Castilleja foliolosa]|uniref:NHL repeat-containing protein n=1 Tax=Castilleja foliolosa TaxID=1961234 RepID=A0ABD3CW30_9LAMI
MRSVLFFIIWLVSFSAYVFKFKAQAAPAGPLIEHLSSLVKWTRSSSKTPHQSEANVLQFEDGYLVETVVEGNELGVVPYFIRVSQDGELFAVDADNSNIVRITPPLSQYSRARLVAGSFQGYTGHVDGKPTDARFNHPKGVTVDDKGNVYVADTLNHAIRKIGEAGVTTIAGGKSNVAGYRDGPSEDAKFSNDFDIVYVWPTCSLLVIDRGNAALRQISLSKEDCEHENSSVSPSDLLMVVGAIIIGYISCILQQGFGSSFFSKMPQLQKLHPGPKLEEESSSNGIPTPIKMTVKDEPEAGWPSFGQLVWDLGKLSLESLGSIFFQFVPMRPKWNIPKRGLTPLKDSLVMPEDESGPSATLKQRAPPPLSEARQAHGLGPTDRFSETKPIKIRSSGPKDPSLPTKHRSSRRQEYAEFYGPGEVPQYGQVRSKSQKDRTKHRQREKSGDVANFGAPVLEAKGGEARATGYENTKYESYNFRNKYGNAYRYD